jgi:hypothetical protein
MSANLRRFATAPIKVLSKFGFFLPCLDEALKTANHSVANSFSTATYGVATLTPLVTQHVSLDLFAQLASHPGIVLGSRLECL